MNFLEAQNSVNRPLRAIPPSGGISPAFPADDFSGFNDSSVDVEASSFFSDVLTSGLETSSSGASVPAAPSSPAVSGTPPDAEPANTDNGLSSLTVPGIAGDSPHSYLKRAENSLITDRALEHALTKQFIAQYTSPYGIAALNAVLERANIYLPFIKEEVDRRGMPAELAYLPVIESDFQITALSRSGAMGLWQFMLNSISPYNMKVTDLLDERRDFIKSTTGALQKLEDEYKRLGNWELTLAAYNSGINTVTRLVQSSGTSDYWELHRRNLLRPETMNFVPRLIAAAYVLSQPRRYGLNIWQKKFEWAAVPLQRQVSIDIIAGEAGIDRNLMRRLNSELTHGITPAGQGHLLKIPASHLDAVNRLLARADLQLIRYYYHVVRSGDTIWSMSRHYGTSVSMIEQHNPGITDRYLRIGETVVIPAFNEVSTPPRPAAAQNFSGTHVVQSGESFWAISRLYGIDPQVLAEANGMQLNQILHEGRTLRVPIIVPE